MKKIFCFCFLVLGGIGLTAQTSQTSSNGKMTAVIFVLVAILIGVFVYLFTLDRKLTKLENQIKDEQ